MSRTRNQDFLRGTDQHQSRVLNLAALSMIAVIAACFIGYKLVSPRFAHSNTLDLSIDLPFVAPGVGKGTKVIMHGAEVGRVTDLQKTTSHAARVGIALDPADLHGLTDAFNVDFRPENYFGITAVNLIAESGGNRLVSGQTLNRIPRGDFTMSTMIEKGSIAVDGTLTKSMIDALDKVIRYTDGLTPMIQSAVVIADRAAQTQQALPSTLLSEMNQTLDVLPGFSRQAIDAMFLLFDNNFNRRADGTYGVDDSVMDRENIGLYLVSTDLFGAAGRLLASHGNELTPVTQIVSAFSDVVPHLLDGGAAATKLSTLVDRYTSAFSGTDRSKTLNLRVILDDLPAMATPLAISGLPEVPHQEMPR
ncbi:Mce family protein [Nocardia nova]|uniref:Mce family protein n=1 Tax=Nocardia nova TaxID=37330 RepID=UPI0037A9CC82